MNKKLLLLPILSLFLVGCNGQNSPFEGDKYVAKGMTPSHKITRSATNEEEAVFSASHLVSDARITSLTSTSETRILPKKALPSHITASTYDQRSSIAMTIKTYENDVQVINLDLFLQSLYTGSVVSNSSSGDYYVVVSDDDTELMLTSDETSSSGVRTVGTSTSAYDPVTDHDSTFNISLESAVWNNVSSGIVGVTSDGLIGAVDITNATTIVANAYVAGDGSRFIVETNTIFEAYFTKGVDSDTHDEFYYVSYARSYEEQLIISEEISNIATAPIVYLDKPILLSYTEDVIVGSIATNGNYVTSQIPEATV